MFPKRSGENRSICWAPLFGGHIGERLGRGDPNSKMLVLEKRPKKRYANLRR